MTPKFCPHCGGELPLMVSESDIRAEVEAHDAKTTRPPDELTWTRPFLYPGFRYVYCNKEKRDG